MSPMNPLDQQPQHPQTAPVQDASDRAGAPSSAQDVPEQGGLEADRFISAGQGVDPLGDGERLRDEQRARNFAKVGSARPSTLLYTYGPGAIMDLPHFTVMPTGLHDWDRKIGRAHV